MDRGRPYRATSRRFRLPATLPTAPWSASVKRVGRCVAVLQRSAVRARPTRSARSGRPETHAAFALGHDYVLALLFGYLNTTRFGLQESMRKFDKLGSPRQTAAGDSEIGGTPSFDDTAVHSGEASVN